MLTVCAYSLYERVKSSIAARGGIVETTDFAADVCIEALLPAQVTEEFRAEVRNMSAGAVEPEVVDTVFRAARVR